jgi:hypothetical protein
MECFWFLFMKWQLLHDVWDCDDVTAVADAQVTVCNASVTKRKARDLTSTVLFEYGAYHPISAVRDCLFIKLGARLRLEAISCIRNQRTHSHGMATVTSVC